MGNKSMHFLMVHLAGCWMTFCSVVHFGSFIRNWDLTPCLTASHTSFPAQRYIHNWRKCMFVTKEQIWHILMLCAGDQWNTAARLCKILVQLLVLEWGTASCPPSAVTPLASEGDSDPSHVKVNQYCIVKCNSKGCDLGVIATSTHLLRSVTVSLP